VDLLLKRVAEAVLERRHDELTAAVFNHALGDMSDEELCARLRRIRGEERARVLSEDAAAKTATDSEEGSTR
jgi:hypothetical protein